ncbi:MAG TPA: phosphate ABC transporter permease subunit PstC [Ilumatobacteraceae bacterium]|nr:phosphate ABC transporter permease subunit PstC [Ilumatobacteraceae bacterium]
MAVSNVEIRSAADLQINPRRKRVDRFVKYFFIASAVTTFAVTIAIIATLVVDAIQFLQGLNDTEEGLGALFSIGWFPRRGIFDIGTLVVGTFIVTGIAMLVAIPLGLGASVYLAEYARPKVRKTVKPILEILAGVPSVVLGYFAIAYINPNIIAKLFSGANAAFTLAAAGIGVGILTIPIIASVAEDALSSVPLALREASYGLGANRWQSTFKVVFPAAISGIIAALILGVSRAVGETMVVAIAAGATGGGLFSTDPLQPGQTMTAAMAALGFGSDQVAGDNNAFQSLYFIGLLLFFMTLFLNFVSDRLVNRLREEY